MTSLPRAPRARVARRRLIVIVVLRAAGLVVQLARARRHAGERQVVAELERPDVRAVVGEGLVAVREAGRRGDDQALRRRLRAEHVRHRDALRDAGRCGRGDPGRVAHETPVLPPVLVEAIARGADLLDRLEIDGARQVQLVVEEAVAAGEAEVVVLAVLLCR